MNRQTSKRISNINKIREYLREAQRKKASIDYKKLIAIMCLEANVSERTVREYVKVLVNAGECSLEYGELYLNDELKGGTHANDQ